MKTEDNCSAWDRSALDQNHTPPFGSYGDSVPLDEFLKKTTSTAPMPESTGCWARLPCGLCRHTMQFCPMHVQQATITCNT